MISVLPQPLANVFIMCYNKYCDENKYNPAASLCMVAHPLGEARIIEVVVLDKRNSRLRCLYILILMLDYDLLVHLIIHFYVFPHHDVGAQVHCQAYYKSETHLPYYLEFSFKCEIFIAMNGNHCYHTSADENRRSLIYLR